MKKYILNSHTGLIQPTGSAASHDPIKDRPIDADDDHCHHRPTPSSRFSYIPLPSTLALLISWLGLIFFCTKMHYGVGSVMDIAEQLFANVVPYLKTAQTAFVLLGIIMGLVTLAMAAIGASTTAAGHHFDLTGLPPTSRLGRILVSRWLCAVFVGLNHLLHLCWLGILSFLVGLLAVYLGFSPVCIPKSGTVDGTMCFNFSTLTALLAGSDSHDKMVTLVLCGGPVSQFCQLTNSILPWYGWAYFGCICVLLGLSNFNSCLAANFAHCLRHSTRASQRWSDVATRHRSGMNKYDVKRALLVESSGSSSRKSASPLSNRDLGDFPPFTFAPPPKYHQESDVNNNDLINSNLESFKGTGGGNDEGIFAFENDSFGSLGNCKKSRSRPLSWSFEPNPTRCEAANNDNNSKKNSTESRV